MQFLYQARKVATLVEGGEPAEIDGHKAIIVNSPTLINEIGESIYMSKAPIAIVWARRNGKYIVSLRSNGKVDSSKVAEKFDGGGHPGSAGFVLPLSEFKTILSFYK